MSVFDLPVFGPADVFPMMADDELQELAADIKANGLRDPLVIAEIDGVEHLIDGRNRRAACRIAKIEEPAVHRLNGEDPTAFVISKNIHRREMTKGQKAMVVAIIYPEAKRGRGNKDDAAKAAETAGFSATRLLQARTILAYAPALAPLVAAGAKPLDDAYEEAKREKDLARRRKEALADAALWLWGRVRDFERMGYLANPPGWALDTMTDEMLADVLRLAPQVAEFLHNIAASLDAGDAP